MTATLREENFSFQGFKLFFLEGGEGEPLIFLHPLGGSVEFFRDNLSAFVDRYRVLAFDFVGCGRSDKPDIAYDLKFHSDCLREFLKHRGIEKATLVGNSLGGHVALLTAVSDSPRVHRLILANPSGIHAFPRPALAGAIRAAARTAHFLSIDPPERFMRTLLHLLYGVKGGRAAEIAHFYAQQMHGEEASRWKRAFVRTLESILATPLDEALPGLDQRTLIIWGKNDHLLGRQGGRLLLRFLSSARLESFDDAGHFPQYEQPERFNELAQAFLTADGQNR